MLLSSDAKLIGLPDEFVVQYCAHSSGGWETPLNANNAQNPCA